MGNYVVESLVWASFWFAVGLSVGWALWKPKGVRMATQTVRKYDAVMAVLLLGLGGYSIISGSLLRAEQDRQQACISAFVESDSGSRKIRSDLNARESTAQRVFSLDITDQTKVKNTADFLRIRNEYRKELDKIDALREKYPLKTFDASACER